MQPDYCNHCLLNGSASCELPSKTEIAGRIAGVVMHNAVESMRRCAGTMSPASEDGDLGEYRSVAGTLSDITHRIELCVDFHRRSDAQRNPNI